MGLLDRIARSLAHISDASRVVPTFHVEPDTDEFSSHFQSQNAQRARQRRRRQNLRQSLAAEDDDDDGGEEVLFEPTIVVRYQDKQPIVGHVGDQEYLQSHLTLRTPSPARRDHQEDYPGQGQQQHDPSSPGVISKAKFLRASTKNPEGRPTRMVGDRAEWEKGIADLEAQAEQQRKQAARRRRRGEDADDMSGGGSPYPPYGHMAHYSGTDYSDTDSPTTATGRRRRRQQQGDDGEQERRHKDAASLLAPSLVARSFTHRHACVGTEVDPWYVSASTPDAAPTPIVIASTRSWTLFVTISVISFLFTLGIICYMGFGRYYMGDPTRHSGCNPQDTTWLYYSPPPNSTILEDDSSVLKVVYRCGPLGYRYIYYPSHFEWYVSEEKADPLYGYHNNYMPDNSFPITNITVPPTETATPSTTTTTTDTTTSAPAVESAADVEYDTTRRHMSYSSVDAQSRGSSNAAYTSFMTSLQDPTVATSIAAAGNTFTTVIQAPLSDFPEPKFANTRDVNGVFTGGPMDLTVAGQVFIASVTSGFVFLFLLALHIVCWVNGVRRHKYVARLDAQHEEAERQRRSGEIHLTKSKRRGVFSRGRSMLSSIRNVGSGGTNGGDVAGGGGVGSDSDLDDDPSAHQLQFPRVRIVQDNDDDSDDQTHHIIDYEHNIPNKIERKFGSVLTPLFIFPPSHTEALTGNIDKEDKKARGMRRVIIYFTYMLCGILPGVIFLGIGFDVCDRFASSTVLLSTTHFGRSPSYMYVACFIVLVAVLVPPYAWYMKHALQYVMARYH